MLPVYFTLNESSLLVSDQFIIVMLINIILNSTFLQLLTIQQATFANDVLLYYLFRLATQAAN